MNINKEKQNKVQVNFKLHPETAALLELEAKKRLLSRTGALETIIQEWRDNTNNELDGLLNQRSDLKKIVNKVSLIKCLSDDLLDELEKSDRTH